MRMLLRTKHILIIREKIYILVNVHYTLNAFIEHFFENDKIYLIFLSLTISYNECLFLGLNILLMLAH